MRETAEYLAVPLMFTVQPFADTDGVWRFRVGYPELIGCEVAAGGLIKAMDLLDDLRVRMTIELIAGGHEPPTPRASLMYLVPLIRTALSRGEIPDLKEVR